MRRVLLLPFLVLGCADPAQAPDAAPGPDADPDPDAAAAPADAPPAPCAVPYAAGMMVEGDAGAQVTLVELDPAPPARFTNVWTVAVVDPDGAEVGADGVTVTTFMPDHGHGGPAVGVAPGSDGTLVISPIELFMPGRWQIDFHVSAGDAVDLVRFEVCIDA